MGCSESRPENESRYTRITKLGSGAFGTVYKVRRDDGQIFAEKFLPKMNRNSSRRELLSLKNLGHHRNIVRLIDFYADDVSTNQGIHLIVEYCEGGTLNRAILGGHTNGNQRSDFRCQISDGTRFLHENNIVHLDLKPDNILISSGVCKITDFGIAKHWDLEDETVGSLYYDGEVGNVYTPKYYTAPEIIQNKSTASPKSDVFSLGVMFIAMEGSDSVRWINGELLVARCGAKELSKSKHSEIKSKINAQVPGGKLRQILLSMVDKNPQNRPTSSHVAENME